MAESARPQRRTTEQLVAWGVLATVTVFVVWQVFPSLIFRDTTPVLGDLPGHMNQGRHLRDDLFRHGRVGGWSQDWFTGYPSLTFYFPLAALLVTLLDLLPVPYNVALKLMAAAGPVALPLCAYAFGRLNRCDRLTSAFFGVSVLPLLLQPTLFLAGGSITASVGGEYAFELALALGLVVLGVARDGLRTGRRRALTAVLLAAAVLFHLIPALMVMVGIAVSILLRPARAHLRCVVPVLATAAALVGFWALPFLARTQLTAGPDYRKAVPVAEWLFPVAMIPVFVLAAVAVVIRFARDADEPSDLKVFLIVMAAVSGVVFAALPTGRLWNGRFLPIWFLWVCLLAGYGLSRLARAVDGFRRKHTRGRPLESPMLARLVLPFVVFAALLPLWDTRLGRGLLTKTQPDLTAPGKPFFEGYEGSARGPEFRQIVDLVRDVARTHGCGRVHWAWEEELWIEEAVPFLWLVPHWTDGCLPVTQGLFTQSSATAPYVDMANSHVATRASVLGEKRPFDFAAGMSDLRVLGVRYFIASRPETRKEADASPDLRPLGHTDFFRGRLWKLYELSEVEVVEPLRFLPVVVSGADSSRTRWERVAGRWFDSGRQRDVVVAARGPAAWPRRDRPTDLPRRPTAPVTVSRVRIDDDRVSFDVSRTGVPVLVKVSYFPNWQASGADGPWRVTPNQMVVVPTSKTVTLRYGRTWVDHAGWLATVGGIGGVVFLVRRGLVDMPQPAPSPASERPPARPQPAPKRKKRNR